MINLKRGFRRLGWVVTFPVAALLLVMFFERTKEFSPNAYEVTAESDPHQPYGGSLEKVQPGQNVIEVSGLGYAYFANEVPLDVAAAVIADFLISEKQPSARELNRSSLLSP